MVNILRGNSFRHHRELLAVMFLGRHIDGILFIELSAG
jgi:hypothetical protein